MILDIERLINEDIDLKNEMHSIFRKLEDGYDDMIKVYEKFEKPLTQIIDTLKEYARLTSEDQQDSPYFALAKRYESLIDSQKQLVHDVKNDVVIVLQDIVNKSELLNESIKDLNSAAKNARKLRNKINKLGDQIEELKAKGKPEKVPKKESEKQIKESEFSLARDKLIEAKGRFDGTLGNFNIERDDILKDALEKMADAENKYVNTMKDVIDEEKEAAGKL
ncbi:MAG: hypothetical protein HWN67_07170 [Candidatus Helarchaeota archaeon]|nr:hypothetical protein [Candidatus Helarchaeota archaeon]